MSRESKDLFDLRKFSTKEGLALLLDRAAFYRGARGCQDVSGTAWQAQEHR